MRPLRLTLENFAGIASGQGKKQIILDLEQSVPMDAQIVAIAGPNGAGKTTIMDNLTPYRLMPSRASKPSPSAFSYYEHIVGGEGSKELLWEHCGVRYQSVLRFRSTAKTKKTEAYLYVVDANGATTPWTDLKTGAQSDGKTDTYDGAIEAVLGKPEVFFQAQFSAQGKEPIGNMSASDVKRLIADMIGANRSSELSGKANEIVKALKPRLSAMQDEVSRTEANIPDEGVITQSIADLSAQCEIAKTELATMTSRESELIARIAAAGKDAEQLAAARQAHEAFNRQLNEAVTAHQNLLAGIDAKRDELRREANNSLNSVQSGERSAREVVGSLQNELQRLTQVAATFAKVDAAVRTIPQLQTDKASKQGRLDQLTPQLLKLESVQSGVTVFATELANAKKDGEHLANALVAAQETAKLLSEVPCQGTDLSGRCKLLTQANGAAEKIPDTEVKLQGARDGYRAKLDQRSVLLTELDRLKACEVEATGIRTEIGKIDVQLQQCQNTALAAEAVKQAQESIPAIRDRLTTALDDLAQAEVRVREAQAKLNAVDSEIAVQIKHINTTHANALEGLERIRITLPAISQSDDVNVLTDQKTRLRADIEKTQADLSARGQDIAHAQAKLHQAGLSREVVAQQRRRCEALAAEIAHWVLLVKALGTDGIIAMSIDDAGPAIASIANNLLEDCYGGRFALSLVTQQDTQAGVAKETFRIQVEDNERGETKFLEMMSGGEKVWINECLVRAIALYMAQVSDTRASTLFSDESDGPLDPSRKRQYMAMKRAVIERGGYEREYLITQTPELLGMCDAVIDVSKI
jgi:exonuclease SbcC